MHPSRTPQYALLDLWAQHQQHAWRLYTFCNMQTRLGINASNRRGQLDIARAECVLVA
jgi:hypothetical protein